MTWLIDMLLPSLQADNVYDCVCVCVDVLLIDLVHLCCCQSASSLYLCVSVQCLSWQCREMVERVT